MKKKKEEKKEKIESLLEELKKKFGEGSILRLGEETSLKVESISSGSLALDTALGVKGIPRGRIVEIFGSEQTGKTTLALHIIAQAQKNGGIGAFIDAEHSFDPEWAKKCGVRIEDLLISQPDSGEEALRMVETLVNSGKIDVIVVDSVAALVPRTELGGEMGEIPVGLQARLMSHALRKLAGIVSKTKSIVIFLNQVRMKIGQMYGAPETTPGGLALKFYASVRIQLKRIGQLKRGEKILGNRIEAKVVKNKVAPPFKSAVFDIFYDEGISRAAEIFLLAQEKGIIKRSGNYFLFKDQKLGNGQDQAREFLKENPKLLEEIEEILKKEFFP
ncbi:MAG: recombinase RecA [Minisyncoccales bacterium]